MKGKRKVRSRRAILAAVTVLAAAQATSAYASTGPASESQGGQTGTWIYEGQIWKYHGSDGALKNGWVKTDSGWYYLDPQTGVMQTGWITVDGRRYYMNTAADGIEGQMRCGWFKDANEKWYFLSTASDSTEGMVVTGWQWIDGKCYYFEGTNAETFGQMYASVKTPDGYSVNADGQWINGNGEIQTRDDKGYLSNPGAKVSKNDSSLNNSGGSGFSGGHSGNSHSGNNSSDNSSNDNSDNSGNSGDNSDGNQDGGNEKPDDGKNDDGKDDGGKDNSDDQKTVSLVDETKTKLTEVNSLGWWLPIVYDEGYNSGNTVVKLDGKDVTNLLTPITDDGSVSKLALLGTPGKVTVSSKDDESKEETVVLSEQSQENAVYDDTDGYLPEKILTHESVAMWDYYLTNYDEDGNVRVSPKKTTYNLEEEKSTHPSYSPDAILPENGNATVTIMFNYNTDEEKEWFDGINKLQLVQYDEQQATLNDNLAFASAKNVAHGKGRVGELTIQTGQTNFRNNGRYYVRVTSSAGGSTLVPIHVVNETVPKLELKETPQSGLNLHFAVSNLVYGIESPIERVTLEDPTGAVTDLQKLDDWYLYSQDLFVLYNDNTDHLPYKGKYTITIYANGFQAFSKSFSVSSGASPIKDNEQTNAQMAAAYGFDGISTASTGSSGSSSSDGSSSDTYAVSANLIFDSDLLVNAQLLRLADMENDASKAVLTWWDSAITDAVFDTGDEEFFDWTSYVDACEEFKYEEDKMLPFRDYRDEGEVYRSHPATAKEVLEDGLLGDIQSNGNFSRQDAPTLSVSQNDEGKDVILKVEGSGAADYIDSLKSIVVNGNWQTLSSEKYSVDKENGAITIDKGIFTAGEEYKLTIESTGYKSQTVKFTYDKVLEDDLSLTVGYADGKEAFEAEKKENGSKTYYFADAEFTVKGSNGDFLKNLKNVKILSDEEDATERAVFAKGVSSSDDIYYEVSEDGKKLILHQAQPGKYKLTVSANYYTGSLSCEFEVTKKEEQEVPDEKEIEIGISAIKKATGFGEKGYIVQFTYSDGTDLNTSSTAYQNALENYVNAIKSVVVGTTTYSKMSSWSLGDNEYKPVAYDSTYSNSKDSLNLSDSGFNKDGDTKITVKAGDDYPEVAFVVDKDGNLKTDSELINPPKLTGDESIAEGDDLTLSASTNADSDELENYLKAIKKITTGNTELKFEVDSDYKNLTVETNTLTVSDNGSSVEILISADGYEEQKITIGLESKDEENEVDVLSFEKESFSFGTPAYIVKFDGPDDISSYLEAIKKVKVGDSEYTKASYASSIGSEQYAFYADNGYSTNDSIKLSSSKFSEDGTTTIEIIATGYETVTFEISKQGNVFKLVTEEAALIDDIILDEEIIDEEIIDEEITDDSGEEIDSEEETEESANDESKDENSDNNDENQSDSSDDEQNNATDKENSDDADSDEDDANSDSNGENSDDTDSDENDSNDDPDDVDSDGAVSDENKEGSDDELADDVDDADEDNNGLTDDTDTDETDNIENEPADN